MRSNESRRRRVCSPLICLSVLLLLPLASPGWCGETGSGNITGPFHDAVPTRLQETVVLGYDEPLEMWSAGSGTDHYSWGIFETGRYFLDSAIPLW